MPKITALPQMTAPDGDDEVAIVDNSATTTKRMSLTQIKTWLQTLTGWITASMIGSNEVTKAKLEKPHVSGLLFNLNNGVVFTNSQVRCPYDTAYSAEYGLTATTGGSARITVARDGVYQITMHFKCIDVTATSFITWFYVYRGGTAVAGLRRVQQNIPVGEGWTWSFTLPLLAGDYVYQEIYNGGGATRFGNANNGSSADEVARIMGMGMMVTEVR